MPKPKPTETRKLTYAEAALLDLLPTLAVPDDARVLIAGNRSGWLPLEAEKKWPKRVAAHAFDFHHARAIRDRLAEAWINPNAIVHCTPALPEGPFALALFMTTPQSMSAELVLDQLEDLHAQLAEGGTLVAAFEGDADDALRTLRLVWTNVHVVSRAKHVAVFRMVKRGELAKRRDFASNWEASVPDGEKMLFTSLPGCFCHRRADAGGLALAEVAAREAKPTDHLLDMGCGCGLVGLLVAKKAGIALPSSTRTRARSRRRRSTPRARASTRGSSSRTTASRAARTKWGAGASWWAIPPTTATTASRTCSWRRRTARCVRVAAA